MFSSEWKAPSIGLNFQEFRFSVNVGPFFHDYCGMFLLSGLFNGVVEMVLSNPSKEFSLLKHILHMECFLGAVYVVSGASSASTADLKVVLTIMIFRGLLAMICLGF